MKRDIDEKIALSCEDMDSSLEDENKRVIAEKEAAIMEELKAAIVEDDLVSQLINAKMERAILQSENLKLTVDILKARKADKTI